ncbi:MAG: sulfotransferase [Candidatus Cloacimonetes bacterium]|nr:sulfotransferase [Candidatus Cloacimonadota bacterium]
MKPLRQALSRRNMSMTARRLAYSLHRLAATPLVSVNQSPVFVLGNQKCGTTAIADLLAKQAKRSVTLDIPALASTLPLELIAGETSLNEVVHRNRFEFSRVIIKEPWLTFIWDDLVRLFPQARTLFIVRDPRQNARSILNRLGLPGNLDCLPETALDTMKPGWWAVFTLECRERGETVHYVDALAHRWNRAVEAYFEHEEKTLLLRYEDFVADKTGTLRAVAEELKLPVSRNVGNLVNRQYQPCGNRSVSPEEFFGAKNLARLEAICAGHLEQFGYS